MYLICGIDDLQFEKFKITDSRFKGDENWYETIPALPEPTDFDQDRKYTSAETYKIIHTAAIRTHLLDNNNKPRPLHELLHWDSEYGCGNVIGYVTDELPYANHCLYAMATLYPEFARKRWKRIPSVPLEEDHGFDARHLKLLVAAKQMNKNLVPFLLKHKKGEANVHGLRRKRNAIRNEQNYSFFSYEMETYLDVTEYLFKQIGLHVKRKDMRLILYWQWS